MQRAAAFCNLLWRNGQRDLLILNQTAGKVGIGSTLG
jgi:hypothetical protein